MYFGDMYEIIRVIGEVDNLSDILKTVFLLQGCVQLASLGGVKLFKTRRKKIEFVHTRRLDKGKRHINRFVLWGRIAVNKKILQVVGGNADALHSFVKLLLCGGHI